MVRVEPERYLARPSSLDRRPRWEVDDEPRVARKDDRKRGRTRV